MLTERRGNSMLALTLSAATLACLVLGVALPTAFAEIKAIRSLSETFNPKSEGVRNGSINGIAALLEKSDVVHILFVHGIGWTQQRDNPSMGYTLAQTIRDQLGDRNSRLTVESACPTSGLESGADVEENSMTSKEARDKFLLINPNPNEGVLALRNDDPKGLVQSTDTSCLDRITVQLTEKQIVRIYRYFGDDLLWNAYQYPHLGYDDPADKVGKNLPLRAGEAYEAIDEQRAKYNSLLKNQIVTFGLSDATLYLSKVGTAMRSGLSGAICATVAGVEPGATGATHSGTRALCDSRSKNSPIGFAIVSHSMGSRLVFDVMHSDLNTETALAIKAAVANDVIEVFMLANQIPLLGIGRLGQFERTGDLSQKKLRLIAISEINDLLTYELVPYFEHLYFHRCYGDNARGNQRNPECKKSSDSKDSFFKDFADRQASFVRDIAARQKYVEELGFEVIDVRASFAGNTFLVFSSLKDPLFAHTQHLSDSALVKAMMCGGLGTSWPLDCRVAKK
jgi:hypothetical protein